MWPEASVTGAESVPGSVAVLHHFTNGITEVQNLPFRTWLKLACNVSITLSSGFPYLPSDPRSDFCHQETAVMVECLPHVVRALGSTASVHAGI